MNLFNFLDTMICLQRLKSIAKKIMPSSLYHLILARYWSSKHSFRWGNLRRVEPISRVFGLDRGQPIDRYYIEQFLSTYALNIQGRVLEIGDNFYTLKFGGERVTRNDVLHAVKGNPEVTIVADLTCADHIPSNTFDCIICTQTLQCIYDVRAATQTLYRILRPGGVLLATCSGISQISRYDMDRWGEYWRFTTASAQKLFEEFWFPECLTIEAKGNVLVATAYLYGLASNDLETNELEFYDPDYQMLITVRAVKPCDTKGVMQ